MSAPRKRSTATTTRTRKTSAATEAATTNGAASTGEFVCPECGRSFSRAAALGAHRRRAHNVAGATMRATTSRPNSAGSRSAASEADSSSSRQRRSRTAASDGVNRNGLLRALFPNGIPANDDAIRSVSSWLDEAERLAKLK